MELLDQRQAIRLKGFAKGRLITNQLLTITASGYQIKQGQRVLALDALGLYLKDLLNANSEIQIERV